ncbi:LAQU0S04e07184g1_1 [Lachancea quebecensis]|uniref:LAQU0S04e07184g1_1 n=1 Tax=Lachancea quebecensis TaxID=1654605 RepID=A0A0P1KQW1_9SACH|nr:LAQU0S04e07184g1_1 [Lachancea quebecensis]
MPEEEEKRLKQLEEARKRVQELKNKKKKKDKKKKTKGEENDSEAGNASENASEAVEESGDTISDPKSVVSDESAKTIDDHASEKINAKSVESEESKGAFEESSAPKKDTLEAEPTNTKGEGGDSSEEVLSGDAMKQDDNQADVGVEEAQSSEEKSTETTAAGAHEDLPEVETVIENQISKDQATELFSSDNDNKDSDFLTELQRENDRLALIDLEKQVAELTSQLRKLKFVNMEQETTIEELQEHLHTLEQEASSSKQEIAMLKQELVQEKEKSAQNIVHSVEPSHLQTEHSSTFGQFTNTNPVMDRAAIEKWKNWNVDMTSWRSIGSGPVVHF